MFWKTENETKLIWVRPTNYRCICLHAIEVATNPKVFINNKIITDYSEQGKLTQKGLRDCIDFKISDGDIDILGFHDHPNEMWVNYDYFEFAQYCKSRGWLEIENSIFL